MIDDMKLRGLHEYTGSVCVGGCSLARYYKRSPDLIEKEKIQAYLLHLMDDRKLSWALQCHSISAKIFLHANAGIDSMHLGIPL